MLDHSKNRYASAQAASQSEAVTSFAGQTRQSFVYSLGSHNTCKAESHSDGATCREAASSHNSSM